MNFTLTITINGETEADVMDALAEVVKSVDAGNMIGFDRNESSDYRFEVVENNS